MLNKTSVTRFVLRGLLFYILLINVSARELNNKETSDGSNIKSESLISIPTLSGSHYVLSNYVNEFSEYNLIEQSKPSYKSPWVAFLLSYIIPGSGQIYNGEIIKGLVFTGTFVLGAAIALIPAIGATSGSDWPTYSYIGAGIACIAYVWQLIDAPISASRINEENNLSLFRIDILDGHHVSIGLSSESIKDAPAFGLKVNYKVPIF
jgi:hypothetical protein